jgi:nucleoside-diphosphate-sugar epimerase
MKFLVTGAKGFIGTHVKQALERDGHNVIATDLETDVSEAAIVEELFLASPGVEGVVHLAYVMGAEAEADPVLAMRVNALGTANVMAHACRSGVTRILFLSSESVYGRSQAIYGDRPVREDDYCAPADHALNYSVTKLLNEHLAAKYEARYGTEIVSLRAAIVYGPGRKRGTTAWASDFVTRPALGEPVALPFPPWDRHCYIYVEDLAEQIRRLMVKPELKYRIYNSGGHTLSGLDIAALIREVIPGAQIAFREDLPCSPFIYRMDDSRIREEIGFQPRPMRDGIAHHKARICQ